MFAWMTLLSSSNRTRSFVLVERMYWRCFSWYPGSMCVRQTTTPAHKSKSSCGEFPLIAPNRRARPSHAMLSTQSGMTSSSSRFDIFTFHSSSFCPFLPRCMECRRGLAMRILSVRPSVRLSNAWFVTKWKKRSVQIFISYERSFSLVFWEEEWLVGGDPFYV